MLVYSPRLSKKHSEIVRRISWGFGIPMTKVISHFIEMASSFIAKKQICSNCRDKSYCDNCIFMKKTKSKIPDKKLILVKGHYYFENNGKK